MKYLHELQYALRHLYEPAKLRKSPLVELFGIDPKADAMVELRKILLNGIQKLKPQGRIIPTSKAWKIYTVLSYRFIEQFSQKQVAVDLAISIRQLRRLEIIALESLEDVLTQQMVKVPPTVPAVDGVSSPAEGILPIPYSSTGAPYTELELEWLRQSMSGETTDLQILLDSSLRTVAPLFQSARIKVDVQPFDSSMPVAGSQTILRQVVVNLFTLVGQMFPGGHMHIQVETKSEWMLLQVRVSDSTISQISSPNHDEMIKITHRLMELSGGYLELHWPECSGGTLEACISLPVTSPCTVLVVDDNQDALLLVQRFLAGSRYRFIGTTNPQQVIPLTLETRPHVMILDVMLPDIDGWELLGRLREHPGLQATPIIVSTILPQEKLAITLGASAFLHKPFSQADLLALLDRFVNQAERGSH
jgi:CheY-like chemotaxis protein